MAKKAKKPKVLTVGQLLYICQQFRGASKNSPVYMTDYDGNAVWPCLTTTKTYDNDSKMNGKQRPVELIIFADVDEEELTPQDEEEELIQQDGIDDCSDVCDITGRLSPTDRQAIADHVKKQMTMDCVADDLDGNRAIRYAGVKNDTPGSST